MSSLRTTATSTTATHSAAAVSNHAQGSVMNVSHSQILLNQKLTTKDQALSLISETMLNHGFVNEPYTQALQAREAKVSTYLINGVAIPHGTNEAKHLVQKTGLVIVQIPQGVIWNDKGDVAKLLVGIAASGDEHLSVLQTLTQVVMDAELSEQLANTNNANDILNALDMDLAAGQSFDDLGISAQALVTDEAGMHARPASLISEKASTFENTAVQIRNSGNVANAKSMAALLAMGAKCGDTLVVSAEGEQATTAVQTISAMINAGLDADDEPAQEYSPLQGLPSINNPTSEKVLTGAAASPGIAVASAFKLEQAKYAFERDAQDANHEKQCLTMALEKASQQLSELKASLQVKAPKEAAILQAQKQLLHDEVILESTHAFMNDSKTAAWSFHQTIDAQIEALNQVDDERLKARVADLVDVRERVLANLVGDKIDAGFPQEPFVLLATDLTPSQTAGLEGKPVKAICTELGGPNSHMAILARALGIPALVGVGQQAFEAIEEHAQVVVDAQSATLLVNPDEKTQQEAQVLIATWQNIQQTEAAQKHEAAITKDNHSVDVVCNIAKPEDAQAVVNGGGEGVGLLRTEFLFEAAEQEPPVSEQQAALTKICEALGPKQLVVRTCDIGGDKPVQWMDMPKEENPFLGIRGIRLSFKHEDIFRRQLEAIYRTAQWQVAQQGATGIHIMFPMVAKLSEWEKAKAIAEDERKKLDAPVVPLGIMVEVPSAAMIADQFAEQVDFFSVGSNDLTQYTLAMDRLHADLCKPSDNYHPAILRLIDMTVRAAQAHNKWVGVCGNMAADPNVAALLVGLGVHELSVSPSNVASVKNILRSVTYEKLKIKANKALQMGSSEAVMALYQNHDDLI